MSTSQQINIYRHDGEWCYAIFMSGDFDSSDTIGCANDASEDDAHTVMAEQFPAATIVRVPDPNLHEYA